MSGNEHRAGPQAPDRVSGPAAVALMVAVAAVIAGGVWWSRHLLQGELERARPGRPVEPVTLETGVAAPELVEGRVLGLLAGPIEERRRDRRPAAAALDGEPPVLDVGEWEWVDRERGLARVPVEVAMDLLIARQRSAAGAPAGDRAPAEAPDSPETGRPAEDRR